MKKYSAEDLKTFEVVNGFIICPTGDYTEIEQFPRCCSFGVGCSFGKWCSFGERCSFGENCRFGVGCHCEFGGFYHVISCGGFGSEYRTTYFFGLTDGRICVRCGCFHGTIEKWAEKVKKTHGDSLLAKAYLGLIEPVETMMQYVREKGDGENGKTDV